ncbi:MAG: hypothetical protein JWN48_1949, partial [Myxococcaceae bacterium]|nr:hypothetical protein [Myxococcaceae bacterium]
MLSDFETAQRLDRLTAQAATLARPVASLTALNAAQERARLVSALERGEMPVPAFGCVRQRIDGGVYRLIDEARLLARRCPIASLGELYEARLQELEIDLAILDAWGDEKLVRPLSARRYGRGNELVTTRKAEPARPLSQVARSLLATLPLHSAEPALLKADAGLHSERSVASLIRHAA